MAKHIGLSGTALKLLACLFMVIDHVGMRLLPEYDWMRYVGRLAFPLFAFFIAEGCRYTKNRLRYLLTVCGLGVICEAVYIVAEGEYYGNILLTFSLSIALIYLLQECKSRLLRADGKQAAVWGVLFVLSTVGACLLVDAVGVDYGFAGACVPVLVSVFDVRRGESLSPSLGWLNSLPVKLCLLTVALLFVAWQNTFPARQIYALAAVPLLALYNGTPGKNRFKYGFYLFYPLHLAAIELIAWIV